MVVGNYHPNIQVAIRRCISAFAERDSPEDALVDLVIGLESLFGDTTGELRLRIAAALAWLLADNPEDREAIRLEARDVYDARSEIVHGGLLKDGQAREHQLVAERLLLGALAQLATARTDLLTDRDRSLKLIIGQ